MFGKYMDFTAKRDVMGAAMFFVAHLVVLAGLSSVLVHFMGMAGMAEGSGNFFDGGGMHHMVGTAFVVWLGGSVLAARKATNDIMSILIVAAGVYFAWTSGAVMGLVPIALLTTIGK